MNVGDRVRTPTSLRGVIIGVHERGDRRWFWVETLDGRGVAKPPTTHAPEHLRLEGDR